MSKKSFVVRMDPLTLKLLEKWAADEFRSLNGQIEYLLYKALRDAKRLKANSEQLSESSESDKKESDS